jgi:hypothetical protein
VLLLCISSELGRIETLIFNFKRFVAITTQSQKTRYRIAIILKRLKTVIGLRDGTAML